MKKFVSLILSLAVFLSLAPCAFAASGVGDFTDVPSGAWYAEDLAYALHNGYISGTSATTFSPEAPVTRGQFVTILGRMAGAERLSLTANYFIAQGYTFKAPDDSYKDVKFGSPYWDYVEWAAKNGIMGGTNKDMFSPDAPITVEQMGTAIANLLNIDAIELGKFKPSAAYADTSSISEWAVESMALMQKCGLLVVDSAGNVNPHKNVTRAECTVSVVRIARAYNLGTVPVVRQKSDTAEVAAKKIHEALWTAGVLNSNMTQKDKARVYFDWLKANCQYDFSFSKSRTHEAYGALVNGVAVCDGFTKGYNLLLETEGIECSYATTPDHMWTVATLDNVVYHIDVTNGYFCLTPEDMWWLQSIDDSTDLDEVFDLLGWD